MKHLTGWAGEAQLKGYAMKRSQRVKPDDLERLAFDTGQPIEIDRDAGVMVCRVEGVDFYAALPVSS